MLDRLESLIVRRPRSVVALVALVTAILAVFAVRIRLDGSVETVLPRNDPEKRYYDEVRRLFGSDEVGVVALITANVYEPKTLEKLGRLTEEIGKVEGVEAAYSLTNAVDPIADVLDPPPLIPAIPRSREEEQELRQKIADRPIYLKNLVSADGRAAAINILFAAMNDDEFRRRGIDERIEAIVERERGADELYYTGLPHLKVTTVRAMWQDLTRLVPVTVAIIVLVLLASFRSVRGVLLPVATVTITLVWTLGVMVLTGRRLTIGTFPLPPLLLVIGTAYALHVVAESIERSRSGGEVADTVLDAVRRMRLPVFVAALTTALGFLSLAVNPISSIREMGIYASIGVAIAGALALVLVPAVLCLLPPPRAAAGAPGPLDGALRALGRADVRHRTAIAALAAVIVAASLACALRIRVDSSYASFFRPDDPIRRATDAIHRNLVGTMAFLVVVDGREPGVLKKLDALKRIRDLQRFVDGLPGVDKTISFIDYLELLDRGSQNPSGDILISPDGKIAETPAAAEKTTLWENLAQYSAVMELVNSSPRSFSMVVNADFTRTAILVRTTLTSSSDVAATADRILAYAAERFPPELAVHPTGNLILLTHTTGNLVAGQVQSFAIAGGVIFAILSGMFLSARIGFLAMLPNLFPIVFFFGLMGLSGAALNVGTSIIASIALGLAVHNTIHIMARLSAEVRRTDDSERAIVDALASVGKPAVASSVLLFFGFLALGLSRFVPIQQFGLLSAATAVAGLFGDLLLLPALLASTRIITLWDLLYLRLGRDPHKTIPLFATLRPAQAKIVALMGRLQRFADGEPIVRQGDVGHEMFVLLSGAAEVRVSTNGRTHRVRELRRGDVFGEMALIRHHTRSADVLAIDDVEVMALDERFLDRVQRRYPRIAAALFLNLSKILSDRLEQETGRARA